MTRIGIPKLVLSYLAKVAATSGGGSFSSRGGGGGDAAAAAAATETIAERMMRANPLLEVARKHRRCRPWRIVNATYLFIYINIRTGLFNRHPSLSTKQKTRPGRSPARLVHMSLCTGTMTVPRPTPPGATTRRARPVTCAIFTCPPSGWRPVYSGQPVKKLLSSSRLIQRVAPKSTAQARGELTVTRDFLKNFSGDQVRFLARSFAVPGDHVGQSSAGYRWPYGPVAIITPFNFPIEIPMLQLMGALYMGNKPVLKCDQRNSIVMEQVIRLLHACGMPAADCDFLNCDGAATHSLLMDGAPRNTLFTGSSRVAEALARDLAGRLKIEDAGFDWKILGPDVADEEYVAWTCDQDAYAYSGQKCSAQSILFMHENWAATGLEAKLGALAARRSFDDLTVGPILSVTNETLAAHIER